MNTYNAPTRGEADRQAAIDEADRRLWWNDHANLVLVTDWMAGEGATGFEVAAVVEKPWHFTDEFIQAAEEEATEHEEHVNDTLRRRLANLAPRTTEPVLGWDPETVHDADLYIEEDIHRGER